MACDNIEVNSIDRNTLTNCVTPLRALSSENPSGQASHEMGSL